MVRFPCRTCNNWIEMPAAKTGEIVICRNCNTRQSVPELLHVSDEPWTPPPATDPTRSPALHKPPIVPRDIPTYIMTSIVAGTICIAGTLGTALIIGISLSQGEPAGLMAAPPFLGLLGLGVLIFCVRDIARNSWNIPSKD